MDVLIEEDFIEEVQEAIEQLDEAMVQLGDVFELLKSGASLDYIRSKMGNL